VRISWVYGDLRGAVALDLTGQDAFAGLEGTDSSRVLQVCERYALLSNGFDTVCAADLWICVSLLGRAPVWREAKAGTSGGTREVGADVMRRASTRMAVLWAAVAGRTRRQ
jgi:hypothetical protein